MKPILLLRVIIIIIIIIGGIIIIIGPFPPEPPCWVCRENISTLFGIAEVILGTVALVATGRLTETRIR